MTYQTTAGSLQERPVSEVSWVRKHLVIQSAAENYVSPTNNLGDIIVTDPPAVDPLWSLQQYEDWFRNDIVPVINNTMKKDAVFILIPRNRKGGSWLKSIATASILQQSGWNIFRQVIWERQEADFNRSKYAFGNIYFFRRGNRSSNQDSPLKYKDIVRVKDKPEGFSGEFPVGIVRLCLSLFIQPNDIVLDLFAGSGAVAEACDQLLIRSISIEIDRENYLSIIKRLEDCKNA